MSGGGGYKSKPHVEKPVKTGRGNLGVSVGRVGQLGNMVGNHVTADGGKTTGYRGEGPVHQGAAFRPVEMGNAVAASTQCGVGGSRTVYKTGSQGTQGGCSRRASDCKHQKSVAGLKKLTSTEIEQETSRGRDKTPPISFSLDG
jgi:hypothetical protein